MADVGLQMDHKPVPGLYPPQHQPIAMHAPAFVSANHDSGPLSNLNLLRSLTTEKKQTKDGQPAKRRGPKPDSKPALTRRQELNRQAQRTHRERKEMYIKTLEQEVMRVKESWIEAEQEKDAVLDENRRLKELLANHGIAYDFASAPIKLQRDNTTYGPSSSGSISGSYADSTHFSPPTMPNRGLGGPTSSPSTHRQQQQQPPTRSMAQLPNNDIDYDQIGIDFVLTLERPCMDHMQYLLVRSHNVEGQPHHHPLENPDDSEHEHMSGHALMATAPPHSHIMEKPAEKYPFQMPLELNKDSLAKLLDLSNRLPIDHCSEITPVMAWTKVFRHDRLGHLTAGDLEHIKLDLSTKVRCYGFGAVVEEFEVQDAIDNVFSMKDSSAMLIDSDSQQIVPRQVAVY